MALCIHQLNDGVVLLSDNGSKVQCVRLLTQDVSAIGIADTAANIAVKGINCFRKLLVLPS